MTSTNGRRITTHEATVKTAAVEVKTLTISGKQVTLAVFRQLRKEDLIDEKSGDLVGVPWGTVNYFWGDCAQDSHLHVVWQKGIELRRSCLPEHAKSAFYAEHIKSLALQYVQVRLSEGWRPKKDEYHVTHYVNATTKIELELTVDRSTLVVALGRFCSVGESGGLWCREADIRADLPPIDSDQAYAFLRRAVARWRQFQARWAEHYQAVRQLDQLFIAV